MPPVHLAAEAWRSFFDSFQRSAFRLETLPSYGVASENDELRSFLETGMLAIPYDDQWLSRVRQFSDSGRWVGRVHVLRRPLSEYLRYEFAVYEYTVRAGEEVRILDLASHPDVALPGHDFWLFDDAQIVRMDYDAKGRQLGRELLEDVDPAPYVACKQQALALSVPFLEYKATLTQ